ncbi:hypothetical protein MPH_02309 [Macrophomina phaseolina MS6]|uniref:Uncharacterized protein n=1 Tax=Macrophomina phaseolina (strain MS6) TaxID=1126212 RepID=K2S074_MACPH|nr:hypothetical protein MPH_02309 [Macrophomina phaseolina MS6]
MASPGSEGPLPPNQNAGPSILGVTIAMTLLGSVISLAPRLYVRIRMIRDTGWDVSPSNKRGLLKMAIVITLRAGLYDVHCCRTEHCRNDYSHSRSTARRWKASPQTTFTCSRHHADLLCRHRQYIDPSTFSEGLYLNYLTQPIYLFIAMFVKESVGFFLLRITGRGKYRILIISIMGNDIVSHQNIEALLMMPSHLGRVHSRLFLHLSPAVHRPPRSVEFHCAICLLGARYPTSTQLHQQRGQHCHGLCICRPHSRTDPLSQIPVSMTLTTCINRHRSHSSGTSK